MAREQERPRFEFFQAPRGPDPSQQYSDWTNAILARGDAISKPLLMLMQNLAEKQGQQRAIAARNAEHEKDLDYTRSRDVVQDAQFQQRQALAQTAENRQNAQDLYSRNQDVADLDATIAGMTPGNFVEKTDPMLDRLVQMRNGMQPVPNSPMPEAAPHAAFLEQFMRTQERAKEQAAALQQEHADQQNYQMLVQNAADAGTISKPEAGAYRLRAMDPVDRRSAMSDLTTKIHAASTTAGDEAAFQASLKLAEKNLKTDYAEQPGKIGEFNAFKSIMEHSTVAPNEKTKMLADFDSKLRGVGKSDTATAKKPTIEFPGRGTFDVPDYVAKGGGGSQMTPDVEDWIHSVAMGMANNDPRFKSELGAMDRSDPAKFAATVAEYEPDVRKRVAADFNWHLQPPLPYGEGAPAGEQPQNQQPAQSAQQSAAPQQSALGELPPEVSIEAKRILKEKGREAALIYLLGQRRSATLKGSVIEPKPAAPVESKRGPDFGERRGPGPF